MIQILQVDKSTECLTYMYIVCGMGLLILFKLPSPKGNGLQLQSDAKLPSIPTNTRQLN